MPPRQDDDDEYGLTPATTATATADDEYGLEPANKKQDAAPASEEVEPTEENLPGLTEKGRENIRKGIAPMVPPTRFEKERPGDQGSVLEQGLGTIGRQVKGAVSASVAPWTKGYEAYETAKKAGLGTVPALATGAVRGLFAAAPGDPYGQAEEILNTPGEYKARRAGGTGQEGNVEGYNPVYSALAPTAAQAAQVDLPTMEAAARTGNVAGVEAEAAVPAAELLAGTAAHEIAPAAKAVGKKLAFGTPITDIGKVNAAVEQLMTVKPPSMNEVEYRQRVGNAVADLQDVAAQNSGKIKTPRDAANAVDDRIKQLEAPIADHLEQYNQPQDLVHPDNYQKTISDKIDAALNERAGHLSPEERAAAKAKVMDWLGERPKTYTELEGNRQRLNQDAEKYYRSDTAGKHAIDVSDATAIAQRAAGDGIRDLLYGDQTNPGLLEKAGVKVTDAQGQPLDLRSFRKRIGNLLEIRNHMEDAIVKAEKTGDWKAFGPIFSGPSIAAGGIPAAVGMLTGGPVGSVFGLLAGEAAKAWGSYLLSKNPNLNVQKAFGNLEASRGERGPALNVGTRTVQPQHAGGQGAITPQQAVEPIQGPELPVGAKPFEISGANQPNRTAMWENDQRVRQVPAPPEPGFGGPHTPVERPMEPIQGEQMPLHLPETPQEAPLWNLEPINHPQNVPELQRLPGAGAAPQGLEAEPGQAPERIGGPGREGEIAKMNTTPASQLQVGDTFVDDKGDPRRITEIGDDGTIKTADHTMRDYEQGEIDHVGEINSPRAQLARGGMFHPAVEEGERYDLGEIGAPRQEVAAETGKNLSPADKAIEAIKERVKDRSHEGEERDYQVVPKGQVNPRQLYQTTFLLDDGSALQGDMAIKSHMQLAREIGREHLNNANAIRVVTPDSFELHGMPSEEQLGEMKRYFDGLPREDRTNVHDPGYVYWDFYPEDVKDYSADAVSEKHESNAGSFSDFRRAIEAYYGKEEAGGGGFKPNDVRISTRTPTALRATENPHTTPLTVDMDAVRNAQGLTEKLADVVKQYPDLAKAMKGAATPAERLSRFVDHIADNLEWLHNQMPPEIREITRKWYDSANKMATDLAKEHGVDPKQTSGVMAALSPQKDWNMNVSLAKRVIQTIKNQGGTVTSPEMLAKAKELTAEGANPAMKSLLKNLKGKTLDQITDPYEKAAWIRLYDEAHNPRAYEEIAPDGRVMGNAKTIKGADAKVAWGDLGSIEKAVNIMLDGSRENISNQLGSMHKVRNFYNNIVDPMSEHPDVTIDTHAVAAGHIQPFSGNSHEVSMNFGGPSSAITGSNGTYPLYAEAYRKAAARLGIKPRELQSIVWEQVRDLFPAEWKTPANAKKVAGVWGEYGKGKLTLDAARKQIVDLAGGFKKPEWFEKR